MCAMKRFTFTMDPYHISFIDQKFAAMSLGTKGRFVQLVQQLYVVGKTTDLSSILSTSQQAAFETDVTAVTGSNVANVFNHPDVFLELQKLLTKTRTSASLPRAFKMYITEEASHPAFVKFINGVTLVNVIRKNLKTKPTQAITDLALPSRLGTFHSILSIPTTEELAQVYDYSVANVATFDALEEYASVFATVYYM